MVFGDRLFMVAMATVMMMTMQVYGQSFPQITGDGCGSSKGCFADPSSCSNNPTSCDFFVSWTLTSDGNNLFEITGDASSYVAVGFSKSGMMRDSDVYACTNENQVVRSRNTVANVNDASPPLKGVSNATFSLADNRIQCRFTRQPKLDDGDDTYYDLSDGNKYNIIMAKSNMALQSDGNIDYHFGGRALSSGASAFDAFGNLGADDSQAKLYKAHAIMMIIAWVGFASIGITIARYFKPLSKGTKICDQKPIWFAVHRFVMVAAFLFTVIAFIIIFVAVQGFVDTSAESTLGRSRVAHAIFGIIVTTLALVNPVMAIFRPHPGEPKRPLFNWAHRIVGMSAHFLGMVTICLGLRAGDSTSLIVTLPSWIFIIMIIFIIFHYGFWIVMQILECQKSDSKDDVPMQATAASTDQSNEPSNTDSEKNSMLSNVLFLVYFIAVIVFVFIIFISVASG